MTNPAPEPSPAAQPRTRVCLLALYLYQSIGMRQVSADLRAHGHDAVPVYFKEFRIGEFTPVTPKEEELLLGLLGELRPGLVGISVTSAFVADLAFGVADKIRARLGIPVVLGGGHATSAPEECLEHADYVCLGEGDEAICELADAIAAGRPADSIPNIWTKVNGEIRRNDVRPLTQDLDQFPRMDYCEPNSYWVEADMVQQMDPAGVLPSYQTHASRLTCPFRCHFCGGVYARHVLYANKGPLPRFRSPRLVVDEIVEARRRNPLIDFILFWDEVFGSRAPAGWLEQFADLYAAEVGLPFRIMSHPALVTDELIGTLKRAGLACVELGIESGSERVRKEVLNRQESNAVILRAVEILQRHGVQGDFDFIVEIPWETEENLRGTFELVMQFPQPFRAVMHGLSLLPRTVLAERALAEGLIRPEQLAMADRPLPERFASHNWFHRTKVQNRRVAVWHSLICLACSPSVSRSRLRRLHRMRGVLQLFPRPMVLLAEIANTRQMTGEAQFFPALQRVYPRLARFLGRHPRLSGAVGRLARRFSRVAGGGRGAG